MQKMLDFYVYMVDLKWRDTRGARDILWYEIRGKSWIAFHSRRNGAWKLTQVSNSRLDRSEKLAAGHSTCSYVSRKCSTTLVFRLKSGFQENWVAYSSYT